MIGSIGNIAIIDTERDFSIKNVALFKFKDSPVYNKFFFYLLKSDFVNGQITNAQRGGTQKFVSLSILRNLEIPLPPLEEQRRIAAVLDKADRLRQFDRQLVAKYDQLTQSVFLDMFGDPVKNEKGWEMNQISDVISRIDSGWSPICLESPKSNEEEWAVLKLGAVTSRFFKPFENKALPQDLTPKPEIEVKAKDILFSRKNTRELVGACVYVFNTPSKLMMSDTIFRLNNTEKIEGIFLWVLLNDKDLRKQIQNLATGSSGSMPNISKEKLLAFKIPVPPILIQQRFAGIVRNIESQKAKAEVSLQKSEALFNALLQKAFKGELFGESLMAEEESIPAPKAKESKPVQMSLFS